MRVLVINTVRFKLNGISAVIKNYYDAMDKTGIECEFLAIQEPFPEFEKWFADNGLKCHVARKKNPLKYLISVKNIVKSGNFDVVHIHGNSANLALELLACKLGGAKVRIAHSHNTSSTHPFMHKLLYPLFSLLYTKGLACGRDAGKWMFHNKPFEVLNNGIPLESYKYNPEVRALCREELGIKDEVLLGHVGNFVTQKNHAFLLDTFAKLCEDRDNYRLLLISEGMLFEDMKKRAETLGISDKVIFFGKTNKVSRYLQAMDMFVLPSLFEGLPVVLVEAQAAGLPCLVSDTVSREADMTDEMKFIPIERGSEIWVENIVSVAGETASSDRQSRCAVYQAKIADKGYDISKNADRLRKIYLES